MRCILPQALWPEAPPEHAVTCVLASSSWRTVWTGAADGGILSWRVEAEAFDLNEGSREGHAQKVGRNQGFLFKRLLWTFRGGSIGVVLLRQGCKRV